MLSRPPLLMAQFEMKTAHLLRAEPFRTRSKWVENRASITPEPRRRWLLRLAAPTRGRGTVDALASGVMHPGIRRRRSAIQEPGSASARNRYARKPKARRLGRAFNCLLGENLLCPAHSIKPAGTSLFNRS
ncbi:protein of unknown function (plasmid) [Paraburkholderia dioscoreae]|uniref:Uncharacterized protein n=1 Tax=Paraburkholderia dioscoreae TaxID=2604047 RepID=A0A5Q4ZGX8_9BURK|nr:protein of unknown function [Paraburkholderia dioscoreae]